MLYKLFLWVDVVQDHVRVALVRSSKHNDLEVSVDHLQALPSVGPNVEARSQLAPRQGRNVQIYIWCPLRILLADTMSEGLVEIEDYSLFYARFGEGELNGSGENLLVADRVHRLEEANRLENVYRELSEDWPSQFEVLQGRLAILLPVHVLFPSLVVVVCQYLSRYRGSVGTNKVV